MRRWLLVLLALGLVAGGAVVLRPAPPAPAVASATGERWACPMLDFIGDHPGKCPVCGMTLQKVTAGELSRAQASRMGVETSTIVEGPARMTIHAYGAVRYDERTEQVVVARVAGRITARHPATLHRGVTVAVGDPLVDLYSPEAFNAQIELATAVRQGNRELVASLSQRFARWNLAHVAEAVAQGGAPQDTITLKSPAAGRVVAEDEEALVKNGTEVTADAPLLRLVDPVTYMVVVHVPEPRARMIRSGAKVRLASDDAGELPDVTATISWIAPELNPEIRAREVHLHLRDEAHRLLPGSLVRARIEAVLAQDLTPADPTDPTTWGRFPLVPASAVLSTGVRHVAWKAVPGGADGHQQFAPAPLALGQRLEDADGNDRWVVRAGLAVGDEVATQGAFLIDAQAQLAGTPSLLFPTGAR